MDKSNFIDFIEESDSVNGEYHGWKLLLPSDEEKEEDEIQSSIVLNN
jgi:hypothetical protein